MDKLSFSSEVRPTHAKAITATINQTVRYSYRHWEAVYLFYEWV